MGRSHRTLKWGFLWESGNNKIVKKELAGKKTTALRGHREIKKGKGLRRGPG